jgi:hypothetical protein
VVDDPKLPVRRRRIGPRTRAASRLALIWLGALWVAGGAVVYAGRLIAALARDEGFVALLRSLAP